TPPKLARYKRHDVDVVVDRVTVEPKNRTRLADSLETALTLGNGLVAVAREGAADDLLFSQGAACPSCGTSVEEPQPRGFSFNSPDGAVRECDGVGTRLEGGPARVVPDPTKSLEQGAIQSPGDANGTWTGGTLRSLARTFEFSLKTPWKKLAPRVQRLVLYGGGGEKGELEDRLCQGGSGGEVGGWGSGSRIGVRRDP